LSALGVPAPEIPDPDAAAARWRAELSGRSTLLVLDNAATAAQLWPLLPGLRSGLVALRGATRR
jgi:hypothetical protein